MVRNSTEPRVPSKKVLEAISEGLAEIEAYVDFPGLASTRSEPEVKEPVSESGSAEAGAVQEEESGYEDYYGDDGDNDGLEREEIEVAVDAFLSVLLNAGIIRKGKSGEMPSFTDVFKKFFGKDHEITAEAQRFEEYVEGYFGWIGPEEMRSAQVAFSEIQEIVERALKGGTDAR
jgi:hypothetical protein